eukprot:gb/GEZN01003116.1/.p1 GENE.gb/GEZN01003116.1/~~gb/GEZN01003116.1/.p1  ORF type:complete len:330 (+),score=57.02 gb/GEZN01003116.1/:829-1818(+)
MGVPTGMGVDHTVLIQAAQLVKNTAGMDQTSMQTMLAAQAMQAADPALTRPARRLYIGNLPIGIGLNEKILTDFFNETVPKLGITTPDPIMSCWLASDGAFCFAEFRSVQDCVVCANLMTGITIGDRSLRVGRPADYKPPPPGLENYVVGHPPGSFPPVTPGGAAGTPNAAAAALTAQMAAMASAASPAPVVPLSAGVSPTPTSVLLLLNMVNANELKDDEEFLDIVMDVREESEKYGKVERVVIPRPAREEFKGKTDPDQDSAKLEGIAQDRGPRQGGVALGRIFVKFTDVESCKKAQSALHNRMFNNNKVVGSFFQEELWDQEAWDA